MQLYAELYALYVYVKLYAFCSIIRMYISVKGGQVTNLKKF